MKGNRQYQKPVIETWRTGDIFFSVGDSWKSGAVLSLTEVQGNVLSDSVPTHCGLVIYDKGVPMLVHESTTKETLVSETVEEYLETNGAYILYALPPKVNLDTVRLRIYVNELIKNKIGFDFDFNHHDSTEMYCSEFVLMAIENNLNVRYDGLRAKKYIYPLDILTTFTKSAE